MYEDVDLNDVPDHHLRDVLKALINHLELKVVAWLDHGRIQFYDLQPKGEIKDD